MNTLTNSELEQLEKNAKRFIAMYGTSTLGLDLDGPPSPGQTLAMVEEIRALRTPPASLPLAPKPKAKPKKSAKKKAKKVAKRLAKK